jgi:signal transduction histidine kinase
MPWRSPSARRSSIDGRATLLGAAVGALVATALGRRRHARAERRLERQAREREAERARLSAHLITAEQDERRRLSLGLHDGPLQSLSGIALMHDAALKALREGRVDEAARVLAGALERERQTIQALRDLSFALEPVVLRDQGFSAAVQALADQIRTARSIQVELDLGAAEALGEKAQIALYQTLREALDQAVRRKPHRISVQVERRGDGGLAAAITDDGLGERRRASAEAIGERARILGGRVSVEPGERGGTAVRVLLPSYVAAV